MFIQVKNLTKKFKNSLAVNKINFEIERNKTVGLLGPNGCGKTTSIGMMLGLIKPSGGEIIIDNQNLEKIDRVNILSKMNFASPYVELPKKLTVKQNLEIYGRLYGVKNIIKKIKEISEELDIKKFLEKKTGELSSGQKNRVALAKSFALIVARSLGSIPCFFKKYSNSGSEFTTFKPAGEKDILLGNPTSSLPTKDLPLPGPPAKNIALKMPGSLTPSPSCLFMTSISFTFYSL